MSYFETFGNFQQIWRLNYCFQDDNHDDPMSSHSYTLNADHFCIEVEVACLFLRLLTWVLLSIFGSKGIILKPQKQLSQPYFQDGDGGRMLVLFCCRVLGKRSSAPFGPSSSPLVVEPGFVCIIFILWYFMQSFPMLWMSCAVWERREIFCCLDRVFSRSSLEHCVSSEFPCLSGASGIIRSVAVGEILRAAAQEARSAVQEDWPGVTWRFWKVKFLWRILKSLHHSMQVETRRVVPAEVLNRNFEFARKLKADTLVYVARYVGSNLQDPGGQARPFSDEATSGGYRRRSRDTLGSCEHVCHGLELMQVQPESRLQPLH